MPRPPFDFEPFAEDIQDLRSRGYSTENIVDILDIPTSKSTLIRWLKRQEQRESKYSYMTDQPLLNFEPSGLRMVYGIVIVETREEEECRGGRLVVSPIYPLRNAGPVMEEARWLDTFGANVP